MDWTAFAQTWVDAVDRAVANLARELPSETFYAMAFAAGSGEEGGPIAMPSVGANSVEALAAMHPEHDAQDFRGVRWNPADWRWPELSIGSQRLAGHYAALNELVGAARAGDRRRAFGRHERVIAGVAIEAAQRARQSEGGFARLRRTADFVVYRYDRSEEGLAIAQRTIAKATFRRLFPAVIVRRR
jgi:hypothetical protein